MYLCKLIFGPHSVRSAPCWYSQVGAVELPSSVGHNLSWYFWYARARGSHCRALRASGDGGDLLLVGSTATALAPETFTLTPERRRLTVDLTKANVSAEHVLAMDKRATDRLPEMKHDAETVRACDVSPFANAPGVAPISGAPSFHATSDTEVFVCPAARLAFIHNFKCAGTTLIASMHDLCRATYGDEGFCVQELQESSSPWFCRGGPTRTMEEEWANIQSYTWFTFVREPVSKFESGIFELARRNA